MFIQTFSDFVSALKVERSAVTRIRKKDVSATGFGRVLGHYLADFSCSKLLGSWLNWLKIARFCCPFWNFLREISMNQLMLYFYKAIFFNLL